MTKDPKSTLLTNGLTSFFILAILVVFVLERAATAAESALDRFQKGGVIRNAIADAPPFTEIKSDGNIIGASQDLTNAILKRLGIPKVETYVTDWGAMIPGLQAGRFDIISTGLFLRPNRCDVVLFSEPDVCTARAFAVKKGNPKHLESMKAVSDAKDVKFGLCGGCVEEKWALDEGVPSARLVRVPDPLSALKMLQDGRVDAIGWPDIELAAALEKFGDPNLELVAPVKGKGIDITCTGAAFRREDRDLRDAYDKVLKDMKASGEFAKIVAPYHFNVAYTLANTRDKLCGGPN
jgi:polar amino acid transport system substrate-binding protein